LNNSNFFENNKNKRERRTDMETIQKIALVFTIIGAINWGLVGLFDLDLVATVFGDMTMLSRIVYGLVGICGLINIGILFSHIEQ
jgi:uncharacterized membrane protein YuzA (DUF378 family)